MNSPNGHTGIQQQLSDRIQQKLREKPLAPYGLKARVYQSGRVQLQGIVDVLEEKIQAEKMIREIPGVQMIDNDITVCTDGDINDRDVAFEVGEELTANPEVPVTVGATVAGGEVRLVGSVSSLQEAREAVETASKARGVREIRSELRLEDEIDDVSLSNAVQTALRNAPELGPARIVAEVNDGIVKLTGRLPEKQSELALRVVAAVTGVKGIRNELNQDRISRDDRVVVALMEAIGANPYLNEAPIDIAVEAGRIILSGSVDSLEGKRDIEKVVREIIRKFEPAEFTVENKIRLQ